MSLPSGIFWSRDVYRATFFPLRSDGGIDAPGYPTPAAEAYEGLELVGPKNYTPNFGEPRAFTNVSQGRVNDTIYAPSIEAKTAQFHLSYFDQEKFATMSNVKVRTIGRGRGMPLGTDKQGLEIAGAFMISHLISHDDNGDQVWHNHIIPKCRAVVNIPGANDEDFDVTVNLSLSSVMRHLHGQTLTELADGVTKMTVWDHVTLDRFNVVAWLADGTEDTFLFPTNKPCVADYASAFTLWDYAAGTEVTAGITKSETGVVYGVAPAADKLLIGLYEY